jgi:chemotaxis protein MotA
LQVFAIIGIVVVFAAIVGGYLLEHGQLKVLLQPAELLIILGAAAGTILVANPPHVLAGILKGILGTLKSSQFVQKHYLETLKTMFDLLNFARKNGLAALETDL